METVLEQPELDAITAAMDAKIIRERSDELQGLAGSRSSQAREILARLIETAVGSRKRQRPPEHSTPARTQIARLRKLKFARQQQWQQQHQQQQLAHHVQKLATAGPAPTITSVGVVDGAAVVDCGAVGAGAGGDAERRQLSWLQKERARETARELRTLRHDVSARGIGAELQGVLQMTSAGNADGHSQLAPPERLGELQSLRRSSRVSGLLERSGFRRGLETMLQAMPAPGSQSGTSVSPTTTIVPARFAPPPWQHQHQQQHEQDTHRHRQDAEVAPMVMPRRVRLTEPDFQAVSTAPFELLYATVRDEVDEINHLRAVTSILDGAFRNALESHFEGRAENLGAAATTRARTALAALGRLQGRGRQQAPRAGRNTRSGPGVRDDRLLGQVSELARMVRLSFDLQLDIKRAIQMEVAAAMTNAGRGRQQPQREQQSEQSEEQDMQGHSPRRMGCCLVCLDNPRDTLFYSCGHYCACSHCARELKMQKQGCPVCRAPINDVVRVFDP